MKYLRNQDGIALVVSLMFTLVCLGMIMTLMYFVLASTRISGAQARYRSSLEASYGGVDFLTQTVIPRLLATDFATGQSSLLSDFSAAAKLGLVVGPHLQEKMTTNTSSWVGLSRRSSNPKQSPDVTFTLPSSDGSPGYTVYTKIIDTVTGVGLLDASGIDYLDGGLGVAGAGSSTQSLRTPNMYTIEVQGEKAANPREKANISVLYAY